MSERIDNKYKIPVYGTYHKGVNYCPDCDYRPDRHLDPFFDNACGFCDTEIGLLIVLECPKCFEKWSCHACSDFIMYFLLSVDGGTNKHFKNDVKY